MSRSECYDDLNGDLETFINKKRDQKNIPSSFMMDRDDGVKRGGSMRWFKGSVWATGPGYWSGVIPRHQPFKGDLISVFGGSPRPFIQPWIPEPEGGVQGKMFPVPAGVHLQFFTFPDGRFWGRTKHVEYMRRSSIYTRNFDLMLRETNDYQKIKNLCDDTNYSVFGWLYGSQLPNGYQQYDCDVNFKISYIQTDDYSILNFDKNKKIARKYNIDVLKPENTNDHPNNEYRNYREGTVDRSVVKGDLDNELKHAVLKSWEGT